MTESKPKTEDKPDYLTGYMMCKDILPELSKRINLGAHKYEPDDWKTRPPKYFWGKLHRHMKYAADDENAMDEDNLPHLTAMWFHITALVWKRQYGKPEVGQGESKPHPGYVGCDDSEEATEPAEDAEVLRIDPVEFVTCVEGFGWSWSDDGEWYRPSCTDLRKTDTEMRAMYAEHLAETKGASGHGSGDTVVSSNLA